MNTISTIQKGGEKTTTCRECETSFSFVPTLFEGKEVFIPHTCKKCETQLIRKQSEAEEETRNLWRESRLESRWEDKCPPLYRYIDKEKFPAASKDSLGRLLRWEPDETGLLLHGPTGTGKTFAAISLLRRLHFEGRQVALCLPGEFARDCRRHSMGDPGDFESWFTSLSEADVLLLDDLGKEKFTERVESELFNLVENRVSHLRPIIATTNTVGDTLKRKLSDDRAGPLVRRLREFCKEVTFMN